jgi:molecular chaperone IbpA
MRTFDFAPLYRSTVGFDQLASLMDNVTRVDQKQSGYPPYNIEITDTNEYRISMAVAGFSQDELALETKDHTLTVTGQKGDEKSERKFLHRGIATRNFSRTFQLAEHVKVSNARLDNGLLHIDLVREIPEAMKPRKIEITDGNRQTIENLSA